MFFKFKCLLTLIQQKPAYIKQFIEQNGFSFLCFVFESVSDPNKIITEVAIHKCFAILSQLIQISFEHAKILDTNADKVLVQSVQILRFFSQYLLNLAGQKPLQEYNQDEGDYELYKNTFNLTVKILSSFPIYLPKIYDQQIFTPLVKATLIQSKNPNIRRTTYESIVKLCKNLDAESINPQDKPTSIFFNQMTEKQILALATDKNALSDYYFKTLVGIIKETQSASFLKDKNLELDKLLSQQIIKREITETTPKDLDLALGGMMELLKTLLQKFPSRRQSLGASPLDYLLNEGLFLRTKLGYPKCKNIQTRKQCLQLIEELTIGSPDDLLKTVKFLEKFHKQTDWRTKKKADWGINPQQEEKSETGFVGLKNIGCICYMNSLMQQLFMIPHCRKQLLEVENKTGLKPEEDTLYQVQMIMGNLNHSQKQYYNPKSFVFAMRDIDGSPINPYEQRDVDEFYNMFMDDLENKIKNTVQDRAIKNVFQGKFVNEMICTGCPHYSERDEPFLNVSLQVQHKKSIQESLEAYIEGDVLEGDNAYHCEKCDKKVDALKRCCFKRLPNVLIMALKRFEFNFDTMQKYKINDYCEFPQELDMYPYSQEHLDLRDLKKKMEKDGLTFDDLNSDQKIIYKKKIPQEYYDYSLRGVVVHMGTSDAGHYYSFIKDTVGEKGGPVNQWYEFNDTMVREFDEADLASECFGGEEDIQTLNMNRNDMKYFKNKIRNAYLVIYERKQGHIDMDKFGEAMDNPQCSIDENEMIQKLEQCKLIQPDTLCKQIIPQQYILNAVEEKNNKFWESMNIFTKDYLNTIIQIVRVIRPPPINDYVQSREFELQESLNKKALQQQLQLLEVMKFSVTFFMTTALRGYDRSFIPGFVQLLRTYIKVNLPISIFILETFSHHEIIKEFLIYCPIPDLKRFVGGILNSALQVVYPHEEKSILNYIKHSDPINQAKLGIKLTTTNASEVAPLMINKFERIEVQVKSISDVKNIPTTVIFMNNFIHMMYSQDAYKSNLMLCQYYQIFQYFIELGETARLFMLHNKMLYRMIDCYRWAPAQQGQQPPFTEKRDMSDVIFFRIDKPLYVGLSQDDSQLSLIQRKLINETQQRSFKFLTMAICNLARSISFAPANSKTISPFLRDKFPPEFQRSSQITQLERDYLMDGDGQLYIYFATEMTKKVTRDSVAKLIAHISFNNIQFTKQIFELCFSTFHKLDFVWIRNLSKILVLQAQIRDDCKDSRHKELLQKVFNLINDNIDQYYKVTDSAIDLLLKLIVKDENFRKVVITNKDIIIRKVQKFTEQNPSFPQNQQKKRIFKKGLVLFNKFPYKIEKESKYSILTVKLALQRLQDYSYKRLENFKFILEKQQVPKILDGYDSDESLYTKEFNLNEELDYLQVLISNCGARVSGKDKSQSKPDWHTVKVTCPTNEMVKLSVSARNSPWIELESDLVAPPKTMANNEKEWIHQFYLLFFNFYTSN